ncbi:hypothetical protein NLG97_g9964 [Lecanicillium saksenae]|uniref:Uncharacterized protein n=1 Tax=Lecanicillium saksenae TaxID=468837 RepID=A0ACC1QHJ1_9HYPO|nr:hypothetical protein NLG97_g9964 [Lecanicillium saksenae]
MHHTSTLAWAVVAAAVLGVNGTPTSNKAPEVKIPAGTIKGGLCSNSNVKHFQGIPFAQPPVGKLRFMPPQPLEGQYPGGVLDATKTPPPCIQFSDDFAVNHPTPSEDW